MADPMAISRAGVSNSVVDSRNATFALTCGRPCGAGDRCGELHLAGRFDTGEGDRGRAWCPALPRPALQPHIQPRTLHPRTLHPRTLHLGTLHLGTLHLGTLHLGTLHLGTLRRCGF